MDILDAAVRAASAIDSLTIAVWVVFTAQVKPALIGFTTNVIHAAGVLGGVGNDDKHGLASRFVQLLQIRRSPQTG